MVLIHNKALEIDFQYAINLMMLCLFNRKIMQISKVTLMLKCKFKNLKVLASKGQIGNLNNLLQNYQIAINIANNNPKSF